jgi:hypothetical protein
MMRGWRSVEAEKPGGFAASKGGNMTRLFLPLAAIGLTLVIVATLYLVMPVNALPTFLPGYDPLGSRVLYQKGMAPLILGVGLLAFGSLPQQKK